MDPDERPLVWRQWADFYRYEKWFTRVDTTIHRHMHVRYYRAPSSIWPDAGTHGRSWRLLTIPTFSDLDDLDEESAIEVDELVFVADPRRLPPWAAILEWLWYLYAHPGALPGFPPPPDPPWHERASAKPLPIRQRIPRPPNPIGDQHAG